MNICPLAGFPKQVHAEQSLRGIVDTLLNAEVVVEGWRMKCYRKWGLFITWLQGRHAGRWLKLDGLLTFT